MVERSEPHRADAANGDNSIAQVSIGFASLNHPCALPSWSTLRPQDIVDDAATHLPCHLASSIVRRAG